ncbi:MAG: hypothetical protein WD512_08410 [Candidatus Paceibacterota bacterium]
MQDKFVEGKFQITKASIPIMLKAFTCGTRFKIKADQWVTNQIPGEKFIGRYHTCFISDFINIRVSNDERRRLIPILKRLLTQSE